MNLENLPTEILAEILKAADSPSDLFRLISASPACYRAFHQVPELIIPFSIARAIPDHTLGQYLAIVYLRACPGSPETWLQESKPGFPEAYFQLPQFRPPLRLPATREDLSTILGIHVKLQYFLGAYANTISDWLYEGESASSNRGDRLEVVDPLTLSESERCRLYTAFLRFELYCRIFPHDDVVSGRLDITVDDRWEIFMGPLSPWEVEEIYTVHDYFTSIVESYIYDLHRDFVEAVLNAPGTATGHNPAGEDLVHVSILYPGEVHLSSNEQSRHIRRCARSMVLRGFGFLYDLMRATKARRLELIRSCREMVQVSDASALNVFPTGLPEDIRPYEDIPSSEDITQGNYGFRMFRRNDDLQHVGILDDGMIHLFLRHVGYVFWDGVRIDNPVMFRKLCDGRSATWYEVERRFGRYAHVGIETRLLAFWLPQRELTRIEGKFRSTYTRP